MRALVLVSLAALSACASGGSTPGRPESETVRIGGPGGTNLKLTALSQSSVTPIEFPIGKVWHALPAAFDAVGIWRGPSPSPVSIPGARRAGCSRSASPMPYRRNFKSVPNRDR